MHTSDFALDFQAPELRQFDTSEGITQAALVPAQSAADPDTYDKPTAQAVQGTQGLSISHPHMLVMVVDQAEELKLSQAGLKESLALLSQSEEKIHNATCQLQLMHCDQGIMQQQAKERADSDNAKLTALSEQRADAEAKVAALEEALQHTGASEDWQKSTKERVWLKVQLGKVRDPPQCQPAGSPYLRSWWKRC
jgi:hypothetical protein